MIDSNGKETLVGMRYHIMPPPPQTHPSATFLTSYKRAPLLSGHLNVDPKFPLRWFYCNKKAFTPPLV